MTRTHPIPCASVHVESAEYISDMLNNMRRRHQAEFIVVDGGSERFPIAAAVVAFGGAD